MALCCHPVRKCLLWLWPICSIIWKHNNIHKPEVHCILHCYQRKIIRDTDTDRNVLHPFWGEV